MTIWIFAQFILGVFLSIGFYPFFTCVFLLLSGERFETWEECRERKAKEREEAQILKDLYQKQYGNLDMSKETVNYQLRLDFFFERLYKKGGGEYDAAFYFIGQFDYDPYDREMVEAVVDLILMKTLSRSRLPYVPVLSKAELEGKLFRYQKGANHPESIRYLVEAREAQEEFYRKKGMIYVPDGNEFAFFVANHSNVITEQATARFERECAYPTKKWLIVEFWEAAVDQWDGFEWWERMGYWIFFGVTFALCLRW